MMNKVLKRLLLAASMCCFVTTANAMPMDDATAAYIKGDYVQDFKLFSPLAAQGNTEAQNKIGVMYEYGKGVTQDYQEAVKWYMRAAAQGYSIAQYNIGWMYHLGTGVTQNYQEAMKWYGLAAAQGHARAQNNIGVL